MLTGSGDPDTVPCSNYKNFSCLSKQRCINSKRMQFYDAVFIDSMNLNHDTKYIINLVPIRFFFFYEVQF